jgi:flagellar biogenesis protein FliO
VRTQRTSALRVPETARPITVLAPQILPAITATKESSGTGTTAGVKTSIKRKAVQRKKTVQRNKPVPKRKVAEKGRSRAMSPARTKSAPKLPSSSAKNSLPQLVVSDKASGVKAEADMTLTVNAVFTTPVSPVLVMAEDEPIEPDMLASNETVADHGVGEDSSKATEDHVFANETMVLESGSSPAAEKQTVLQALALQCTGLLRLLTRAWNWTQHKLKSHQVKKRLRVCESVSLGDKRFIAVIQVDEEQFLVGGSSSSVSTLAHLEPRREFSEVFRSRCEQDLSQA